MPVRITPTVLVALACAALSAVAAHADPSPSPGGLEQMPSADPQSVSRLLAKIRKRYGEDALVINTNLLLNAMRNGSILASGVRIVGFEERRGKRWLQFDVETGLVFDDNTRDELARVHVLWTTIVAPALDRLRTCEMDADGILVRMQYHHRPYASGAELRADIEHPGVTEETSFFVPKPDLLAFVDDTVSAGELLGRADISVDGGHRSVPAPRVDGPTTPGPE